jgi:general secretion pathway protein C
MNVQDLVKRHFWAVGAVAVVASAFFAAKAVGHIVDAKVLTDAKHGPKVTPVATAPRTPAVTARSKAGEPLAERNMFCSDCLPPVPVDTSAQVTPGSVPITSLPLVLIATSVGAEPQHSFATILNNTSQRQGAYFSEDTVPEAGVIKEIHFKYVDFQNTATGRVERLMLLGEAPPPMPSAPPVVAEAPTGDAPPVDDLTAAFDAGIKKIDDTTYEIDRSLVDKVLVNPMAVAKGARVVPSVKNGKANGFKLYAIRPSSVYSKLGLSNGDTIHTINGFDLTSMDKALEVYTKVKEANNLTVSVTRRGKPTTLNYSIR